jgi:S1-C subfamily serine protease
MSLHTKKLSILIAFAVLSSTTYAQTSNVNPGQQRIENTQVRQIGKPRIGLGIVMGPNKNGGGVTIEAVSPKGPANLAGLQAGDVITAIDGQSLSGKESQGMQQARTALKNLKEGQSVKINYTRAGKNAVAVVKASKVEPQMIVNREYRTYGPGSDHDMAFATRWQGLNMTEINPQLGRYFGINSGVLVLSPNKSFSQLQAGDVITKINGKTVANPRDVLRLMRGIKEGSKINMEIMRERKLLSVTVIAPKPIMAPPMPPIPPMPPAPPRAIDIPPPPPPPAPQNLSLTSIDENDAIALYTYTSGFDDANDEMLIELEVR